MNNDRELLELAARAAGYELSLHPNRSVSKRMQFTLGGQNWNPLTDDGDALRLAVSLKMEIYHGWDGGHSAYASVPQEDSRPVFCVEPHMSDPCAATRRAITRAAAEIGRGMA